MDYIDEVGFKNTEIVSTDYWNSLGSFKRKGNKKRTKIIKPPFVFGIFYLIKESSIRNYWKCFRYPFTALLFVKKT